MHISLENKASCYRGHNRLIVMLYYVSHKNEKQKTKTKKTSSYSLIEMLQHNSIIIIKHAKG